MARNEEMTVKQLKPLLRQKYVWPGGYEIFLITDDGESLCVDCVKKNFREVVWSMKNKVNDGWRILAYQVEAVSPECCTDELISYCAHCYKPIGECE